ncbi:YceI family protein [Rhodohalobacter sp. SW132]|uniref:YceI family protein n=1 Tax=Rhodohalobacter sp. SW132 TaxID=2293433 RepID=UPI000E2407C6|nr:YceI family protein [Rhodohalobacter sp. SW132]REL33208.1 YceI family protein [Rhodohalobacter sp. SW132]
MHHFRQHIAASIALILFFGGSVFAQEINIDQENSRLWIEGRSNVNQFSCRAERYNSNIKPPAADTTIEVEVDIAVAGFECGKRRMNRDLNDALMSEEHPFISFEYTDTRSMDFSDSSDQYRLLVAGNLTVAGHTRQIEFPMEAYVQQDGTIRATGKTELRMTDYNVEPPTALLGIVKVDDLFTVHFELFASTRDSETLRYDQPEE